MLPSNIVLRYQNFDFSLKGLVAKELIPTLLRTNRESHTNVSPRVILDSLESEK